MISGSASMVAEASHSWADTGNQIFLLIATRRSSRVADANRPMGYGREAYVWSLLAAVGLFVVGAAVSVWHGISICCANRAGTRTTSSPMWCWGSLPLRGVLVDPGGAPTA